MIILDYRHLEDDMLLILARSMKGKFPWQARRIAKGLEWSVGERCSEYSPGCYVCESWKRLDELRNEQANGEGYE